MKKAVLSFSLLLAVPSLLNAQQTVKIGTFMLPPFMMEVGADKATGGAAVDFWEQYIAPKLGVKVKAFGPFAAMRTIKMLDDGQVDVIPNMTKIPQREAMFVFPPTPLAEITTCLVVRKESPLKTVTCQDDLYNLKIAFLVGGYVPPLLRHEKITIELVSGADYFVRSVEKMEAGRVDAVLHINRLSLLYDMKRLGLNDRYRVIILPVEKVKVYCIFRMTDEGRRLAAEFEKINAPLFRAGVYDRLALDYLNKMP